jgi:capsular exopolysaccharide synthesis family protein
MNDKGGYPSTGEEWAEEVDLRRYLHVIFSRKWLVIGLALLFGAVSAYFVKDLPPSFEATTTLLIESDENQIVGIEDIVTESGQRSSSRVGTQMGMIVSRDNLSIVVSKLKLDGQSFVSDSGSNESVLSGFAERAREVIRQFMGNGDVPVSRDPEAMAIERLRRNLSINGIRGTDLVEITYRSSDPELTHRIPNLLAETHIEQALSYRRERIVRASEWLSSRREGLEKRVVDAEEKLRAFLSSQSLTYFESLPEVANHPTIQRLRDAESETELRLSELSSRYGPEHPRIVSARSDLADVRENLNKELQEVSRQLIQSYAGTAATSSDLLGDGGIRDSRLQSLIRDVATSKERYNEFSDRERELELLKEMESAGARIVEPAVPPRTAEGPGKSVIVLAMSFFGGFFGIFIVLVLGWMDKSLKTTHDVEQRLALPVLTVIPLLSRKQRELGSHDLVAFTKSRPNSFSEAIKTLRTAILLSHVDYDDGLVILVASAVKSEGKTTVSGNLASSFADLGKTTLLVDADMRRPSVRDLLDLDHPEGLSDLTAQTSSLNACLHRKALGEADVIPSGAVPPNPLELLSSKRFEELIKKLRAHYEVIIIDSAPTMNVSDSIVLSQLATGVLLVVRSDSTAYQVAQAAVKKLKQADARVLGVVLNYVDISRISKYGKYSYYGDYYGAYEEN